MVLSDAEKRNLRMWMVVGVRVAALEVGDAADSDAADSDAAHSDAAPRSAGPSTNVGATVVEVFDEGIRVIADDDSSGVLLYDRDDFGLIIGHNQDELPHGYRMHWRMHPWKTECPHCWMCARTAASEAHARGEEEGRFDWDGHGAAVHLEV